MIRVVVAALSAILALASCSDSDDTITAVPEAPTTTASTPTTSPETPASPTLQDLDAAVRTAARTLIDTADLGAISFEYGEGGALVQTSWADVRGNGDKFFYFASSSADGEVRSSAAQIVVNGERFCASSGPATCSPRPAEENQPWLSVGSSEPGSASLLSLDLLGMANGRTASDLVDVPLADITVTVENLPAGGTVWTLNTPTVGDRITRTWHIGENGFLESLGLRSDTGSLILGTHTAYEYTFMRLVDPDPIEAPQLRTPLDVNSLKLPPDFLLPGE